MLQSKRGGHEIGMAKISVQIEDFDVASEIASLTSGRTGIGGLGCFIGIVRADKSDRSSEPAIRALTLEHYPAMTTRAIGRITDEAERRWGLLGCTVIHRVGRMLPGENIVLVLTAAAHRQAALDATAFLIDWLKTKAPFWKREEFPNGQATWVEARDTDDAAAARW
jgi:molybdopterin synthase catalytic subunit